AIVSGAGPVLCVAWDMPFVTIELLRALLEGSTGWDAFLPESGGRRGVEPLCAVYGPACAAAIERQLALGDRRAIGFHADVKVGTLSRSEEHTSELQSLAYLVCRLLLEKKKKKKKKNINKKK